MKKRLEVEDLEKIAQYAVDDKIITTTSQSVDLDRVKIARKIALKRGFNDGVLPDIRLYCDLINLYENAKIAIEKYKALK